jgi:fatty acid-binding protein DegV
MGSMLRIKPLLYLDGTIDALDKVRGSKKALERMVELAVEKAAGRKVLVTLTHVRDISRMNELKEMATKALDCDPAAITYNETGPVIGSHVGPGTVGLGFIPAD